MTTIPRLQEFVCGLNLKTGTYIILAATLVVTFFGLVIVTAATEGKPTETDLDIQYIINMVVSILTFLATPLALYGTYRTRAAFLLPFLVVEVVGVVVLGGNFIDEVGEFFNNAGNSLLLVFLLFSIAAVLYSFLVVFSYYTMLKSQREEIQ